MSNYPRNPVLAYQQGFKDGLKENIEYAYIAEEIINEIAFYNIIDNHVKTKKTQLALFKDLVAERDRVKKTFEKDEDEILIALRDINKIREQFGIPLIQWKR